MIPRRIDLILENTRAVSGAGYKSLHVAENNSQG